MKNVKKLSEQELQTLNKTSWHDQYRESAWIFVGGLPYNLTEGDIICVFSQYVKYYLLQFLIIFLTSFLIAGMERSSILISSVTRTVESLKVFVSSAMKIKDLPI